VARRVSSPAFVGRKPELAALLDALDRAAAGEFAAIFLAGESGVGKSRLLQELERVADERGARVLAGGCVSLGEGELPYAPVRTALRRLAQDLDPDSVEELLGPGREELARLVPEFGTTGSPRPEGSEAAERMAEARLFDMLLAMLGRLGEETPLLLAIEDIHWADRSTLGLIGFLVANAQRERLLLTCSYRPDELHRGHRLRTFLAQHQRPPAVERVELSPFTEAELAEQLEAILETSPAPALVNRFHERTGGNAFFTEELLAASEEGTELPASLRDALMLRIEALPERAQEVLRLAAAHGQFVTHRLLAAACELSEPELHGALREAAARHVLVREDAETYAFRHALLQEALESDLLPGERTRLHLALAQALDQDPGLVARDGRAAAELCSHWLAAQRLPEALGAAVRAGIEAEQVSAYADAGRQFERALELWHHVDDALDRAGMDEAALCMRAAEAAYLSGDGPAAVPLVRAAIAKLDSGADPYRAALLWERLGRYLYYASGDTEGALSSYQQGLDLLPPDEPREELARVLAAFARMLTLRGRTAESIERCEQAIAVARRVGARAAEAHVLNTLGVNFASLGDREAGIEHLREALRMTEELGEAFSLEGAYLNLSDALAQDCELEEAAEIALAGAGRAAELGMRNARALLEAEAAQRFIELGRLDEADDLTEWALELPPSLDAYHQCATRARVEVHHARIAAAERLLGVVDEATSYAPGATWVEPEASARVELELLRGHPEEARRAVERALEPFADHERVFYTARVYALGARAEALLAERARAAGDEAAAAEAAARAEALVDRIGRLLDPDAWRGAPPPQTVGYRELCVAEALRAAGNAAAPDWAAVAERWAELGMPLEEAYARLREAECLVLDGEREHAERALAAGLRIATEAGDVWLKRELESLARRGRLALPEPDSATDEAVVDDPVERLGLTPRELAVLELVATGMTNREIGEELFMATKTASVHVSRILAKLEVSSRVEAATTAQRLGIVR
jgi:DNA-binding CsgD family transcriptional regulator/tetratricopeptide (TPR) repeat protein